MIVPKKRERQRSGIARAPQREWPRHRKFIRSLECSVPGCTMEWRSTSLPYGLGTVVECAHVRTATDGGASLKPADWWTLPLCGYHHRHQHQMGERLFEKRFAIDMKRIALALARQSPDVEMRKAMREAGI